MHLAQLGMNTQERTLNFEMHEQMTVVLKQLGPYLTGAIMSRCRTGKGPERPVTKNAN